MTSMAETSICDLPDELLEQILLYVPTKDAIATTILSKQWRYVWTMLPKLKFKDEGSESIDKSLMQLHKAPKLKRLVVKLGPQCPFDNVDVGKWVENAVNRGVEYLKLKLLSSAEPTSFPKSLYACNTLVNLTLSNNIIVDLSSPASLPSLFILDLDQVVYKDEHSLAMLLSSSPVLNSLYVERHDGDNLTNYTVNVSSLETLFYSSTWPNYDKNADEDDDHIGSLVVDSPALKDLGLCDYKEDYCLIENVACLDEAFISYVSYHDDKFLRSLSSVIRLNLFLTDSVAECCVDAIEFSRLIELSFVDQQSVHWLEALMFLLRNSPILKTLTIGADPESELPLSWNQPNSIPRCLSSHLEIFKWKDYGGREGEKQLLAFILTNSKCLKTVEISLVATCNLEERQKEIESMPRISTSSLLLSPN